jgi:hypothetical protein
MLDTAPASATPDLKTRVVTVLWPAFLMAGVLEMLVFAVVDPHQLHGWGMDSSQWSAGAVYTIAFFLFWGAIAVAAGIAVWLSHSMPAAQAATD